MSSKVSALELTDALFRLSELEFLHPDRDAAPTRAEVGAKIRYASELSSDDLRTFAEDVIREASNFCRDGKHDPHVLYRAFDKIDDVLGLEYSSDTGMVVSPTGTERLYENSGAGVQTSYVTIFNVLDHLNLPKGAHLVDLGSGFGRVGLVTGLWREDLRSTGYEYVEHRVKASRASADRAGISSRVQFFTQDLSDEQFEIPSADAYYLYDPFSAGTYEHVFAQIEKISQRRPVVIIAKGGARAAFLKCVDGSRWSEPVSRDENTLMVFHSK